MLEWYCYDGLRSICRDIVDEHDKPRIRLRTDKTEYPENPYKDFLGEYRFLRIRPIYDLGKGNRSRVHDLCRKYFVENSDDLITLFLFNPYNGEIENAIKQTSDFKVLWNQFQEWFAKKRRDFRMNFDIADSKKQILENGKRPNSHGGVANILKVLTKTMEKQGESIESIAKVQYTICMQAGIYIPDEFIEDVAIALYAESEMQKDE